MQYGEESQTVVESGFNQIRHNKMKFLFANSAIVPQKSTTPLFSRLSQALLNL